jgi:protein ImuB
VVAVEELCPAVEVSCAGAVSLPTRGPSRYFGGDAALAARVVAAVDAALDRQGGGGVRAGVADGRFAAGLAARAGCSTGASAGADPVTVVPAGTSAVWLAPLPVGTLERPGLTDLWARLGLRTLGAVAALDERDVLARFGSEGVVAHRLARGLDERPPSARVVAPDLAVTAELDPPAERVDLAAFVGKALADELHERLAAAGLACTRVAIEAETEHGERLGRLWRHDGALDAGAIAERVRWQLDGWLRGRGDRQDHTSGGLTLLRLRPDEVHPDHGRQLGFWGGSAADAARMARSLARVQGLLGPEAVVTGVLGGGRDHAGQVRLVRWGDPRRPEHPAAWLSPGSSPGSRGAAGGVPTGRAAAGRAGGRGAAPDERPPWPGRVPGPPPSTVHVPALAAEVYDASGDPVVVTGRGAISSAPAMVTVAGAPPRPVTAWAGPWPVEERWWDAGGRRRARVQVTLADGSAHLLSREDRRWGVEATWD